MTDRTDQSDPMSPKLCWKTRKPAAYAMLLGMDFVL
ncbi:MAG: hypothetical protein JWM11_8064 [Planctomycetaceae bacterium]|nr:hypothetical protein [Planctomycetaceae bacterium]